MSVSNVIIYQTEKIVVFCPYRAIYSIAFNTQCVASG